MAQLPSLDNAPVNLTSLRCVILPLHDGIAFLSDFHYLILHFFDDFVVREQAQRDLGEVLDSVSDSLSQSYATVLVRDLEAIC